MSFVPRLPNARKGAILGSAALVLGLAGPPGAWAQCTDNFNFFGLIGGVPTPVQNLLPLGTGSSLSALTSTINTVNTAFLTSTSAFVSAPGNPKPDQQGGGVWSRVIAGTVESESSSVGTLGGTVVATGTQNCHTTTRQDYWGYQFGHDISILNHGGTGANWHVGVTAGYLEAKTKDTTPGGSYFQPTFGGVFSRVSIAALNVPGLVNAGGPFARGTVTIDDINSFLTRFSLSTGTSFVHSGIVWQPFFTASIYHELLGDVTARSLESDTGNPGIDGLLLTTRSTGGI